MAQLASKALKYLEGAPSNGEEARHAELLLKNMERKEDGNSFFKAEEFDQAIKVFREAYLDVSKIPWSEHKKYYKDAMQLLEALRLNLAASHTKIGNYDRALEFCNRAIELRKPDSNPKAFYRYVQAVHHSMFLQAASRNPGHEAGEGFQAGMCFICSDVS
jgi:tetratricopeptide (TPR) repeat protein